MTSMCLHSAARGQAERPKKLKPESEEIAEVLSAARISSHIPNKLETGQTKLGAGLKITNASHSG
jgi:hypothetical protein